MNIDVDAETLAIGLGILLFCLATIYTLADYDAIFEKSVFLKKWSNPIKYAIAYVMSYMTFILKALLVLCFIFVFIVVYNILIVGIFKPLLSDNLGSAASLKSAGLGISMGASEIVEKARQTYFEAIKEVIKKGIVFVFGMFRVPNAALILLVVLPIFLFTNALAYYAMTSKSNETNKVLNTNYHMLTVGIFCMLLLALVFIIYYARFGGNKI